MHANGILLRGNINLPPIRCEKCNTHADGIRGGRGKFTMQCTHCHERVFIFTSPTAPLLIIWKSECPRDMPFYDFVRQVMGPRADEYGINQRPEGPLELLDERRPAPSS